MRIGYFTNMPEQGITAGTARIVGAGKMERELDLLRLTIPSGRHCQVVELPEIGADVTMMYRRPITAVGDHPAEKPWGGTVLAHDDPAAWEGTIAFSARPTVSAIRAHLMRCYSEGLLWDDVPVLWDFHGHACVHWERASSLQSYDEKVADWMMRSADAKRIAA